MSLCNGLLTFQDCPASEKHKPQTRCLAGASARWALKTSFAQKNPPEKTGRDGIVEAILATRPSRPGRDRHLQVCQVHLLAGIFFHPLQGLKGSCRRIGVLEELIKIRRCGSPPTLQEGSQLHPNVHHPVNCGFLRILDLLLCDPSASLLPFGAQGIRQDTCRLVGSHALEHGDKAIDVASL